MKDEIFKSSESETGLKKLVSDFTAQKRARLLALRNGSLSREDFLKEVESFIDQNMHISSEEKESLLKRFEEYVFGYSRLSVLIDDPEISDIRVIRHDCIRVKRKGKRQDTDVAFEDEKEYRQFVEYVAMKNQANISNLNAIARFTDADSHPDFILRFTVSMPLVNSMNSPYLCIRKVPKRFPLISELVEEGMLSKDTAQMLVSSFRENSILICGGNSSGKTTLLNALKESLPDDVAVLIAQQADELTSRFHPDTMFMHSLPAGGDSKVNYDLKNISIAGLTMDVDYFIIGEVKGAEALYLLNAACTGQICAATIHSTSADRATDKLVDYAMYESRYSRNELMRMMDCFKLVVFMKDFKVDQVYSCLGWNEERKELEYERVV